MSTNRIHPHRREDGVTMVEVLVAALLIFLSLGGIFAMNARSVHILRSTRQVTASSLMAQQRLETLRSKAWPEFTNATSLKQLLATPTESEKELSDSNPTETITLSVPPTPGDPGRVVPTAVKVERRAGTARVIAAGDLGEEPMLLVSASVKWKDLNGIQERIRRTVIYRSGLTRAGIFGSALGRPAAAPASALE